MDGEAHATLARLLVLLEIPGETGTIVTNRLTAISCNECPTPELRAKCGCVGNTGFNTDRFLDWAAGHPAKHLPPLTDRARKVVFVEESYLVRRVSATVLGRLSGPFGHVHNLSSMSVVIVDSRAPGYGLEDIMEVHAAMPGAMMHLMAQEVVRLENYSMTPSPGGMKHPLFARSFFLGNVEDSVAKALASGQGGWTGSWPSGFEDFSNAGGTAEHFQGLLGLARKMTQQWDLSMQRVARDRRLFWRCVAPRDLEGTASTSTIKEAPGEAWLWQQEMRLSPVQTYRAVHADHWLR